MATGPARSPATVPETAFREVNRCGSGEWRRSGKDGSAAICLEWAHGRGQRSSPGAARRGSGAVTLHDVAKLAGVAPITASRALNTPDQVSAEVLQKVGDAVARTGYVPNRLAGGLASTRSRLVAAVVPTISGPVFLETVQSLTEALAERGYQLMLGQAGYAGAREDALLEAIIGRRPDGIVLTGIMHSAEGRRRLLASGIPVVETWDLTPTPIDMLVGFSHVRSGPRRGAFLHAKGRRRLAVVAGDDERAKRRSEAFRAAAAGAGAGARCAWSSVPAPTTLQGRARGAGRAAARAGDIDAVFCSSDLLALGVHDRSAGAGLAGARSNWPWSASATWSSPPTWTRR